MKLLSTTHNLSIRQKSEATASLHNVVIIIPSRVSCTADGCGPDTTLGGSLVPNCATCGGSGYTDTTMQSYFHTRVRWWDTPSSAFILSTGMMAGEIGKFTVVLPISCTRLIERAQAQRGSYLTVDGKRAKMLEWSPNHVIGQTSIELPCDLEKEIVR